MYFDLNVPYISNTADLQQTLAFLSELGYDTIALNFTLDGKQPAQIVNQIPSSLPFPTPTKLTILRRCTVQTSDPGQNYRVPNISAAYDILALRPTTEKALQQACHTLDCDLISLDFSVRHPFFFQIKTMKSALDRGIKFEICYAPGMLNNDGGSSRRNLISNATSLIRATRGRGIIISSEARRALTCRGPADLINLAVMWGLPQDRGTEAVSSEARSMVAQAEMKRRSFRGVIDVLYGGQEPANQTNDGKLGKGTRKGVKRKADTSIDEAGLLETVNKPLSKREQNRLAKRARQEVEHDQDSSLREMSKDVIVGTEALSSMVFPVEDTG